MKLIENFIFQNFEDICDQIQHGVNTQKRAYLNEWKDVGVPKWDLTAYENSQKNFKFKKRDVHNAINLFVFLCEHADRLDKNGKFSRIDDTIRMLLKIACGKCLVQISLEKYYYQITNTEQVTKFIFHAYGFKFNKKNEFFEDRINMYNDVIPSELKQTSNLIKYMQKMRNEDAHNSYKWKIGRKECLDQLIYILYDYITIVYMLEYVVGRSEKMEYNEANENKNKSKIIKGEQYKQSTISISLETPEEYKTPSNNIYLYQSNYPEKNIVPQTNGTYLVRRFDDYKVRIDASELSSSFNISHEFTDGCTVLIGIPPKETKPLRPEIFDVFDKDDIPEDIQYLIELLDKKYSNVSDIMPYIEIVKSLINYVILPGKDNEGKAHDCIKRLEKSLKTEFDKDCSIEDVSHYLQSEARTIRGEIVKPYKNDNFADLCKKIDDMYGKLAEIRITEGIKNGQSNVNQLEASVSHFLSEGILNIDCSEQYDYQKAQQELLKIQAALDLYEYDSELANNYIKETISNFYNSQNTIFYEVGKNVYEIFKSIEKRFYELYNSQGKMESYPHFLLISYAIYSINFYSSYLLFCHYTDFIKKQILKVFLVFKDQQQSYISLLKQIEGMRNYKNVRLKLFDFKDDIWFESLVSNLELLNQRIPRNFANGFKCAIIDILSSMMDLNDKNERYNLIGILYDVLNNYIETYFNSELDDIIKEYVDQIRKQLDSINKAYTNGIISDNSDYKTVYAKRVVNRYCDIIKERYRDKDIPVFVADIMNYHGASLPIEYKAMLLNICVDKKTIDLYGGNKNLYEYQIATSIFNFLADIYYYLNNGSSSFIHSYSQKYLLHVYREEIVSYYTKNIIESKDYERIFMSKCFLNLLTLSFNDQCKELAYRYFFDENEQPKDNNYSKEWFFEQYISRCFYEIGTDGDTIGITNIDYENLLLFHLRIQRLEKYYKSNKTQMIIIDYYSQTLRRLSDTFMSMYYPNGLTEDENEDNSNNSKYKIAKYIVENHLTTPPDEEEK